MREISEINMERTFTHGKWIWHNGEAGNDEYTEFTDSFVWESGVVTVRISVSGDYTLFINGKYAASNQYGDFEYYKVYDEIDITKFLKRGKNTIAAIGWYWGRAGMRWNTPEPGMIYEVENDGKILCASTAATLCRKSKAYLSGREKKITSQLGYTFLYDANAEDNGINGEGKDFGKCRELERSAKLYKRPVKKHILGEPTEGKIRKIQGGYIIDFGRETVGLCSFSLNSDTVQNLNISYGEILEKGHVKKIIGERDFSFDYITARGENTYTNYMLRFGCRYMEISCGEGVEIKSFKIIPTEYEVSVRATEIKAVTDRKIYDMCVNTLKLCMLEHYVDCPWREQCLYAFDSRNQMLAGYYAFEGGNYEYARANLLLMSKDNREDGLLSICYPSGEDLTIPSFSLYFLLAVKEYTEYSGDITLAEEVFDKAKSVIETFCGNMRDDLVYKFGGANHWNFYDWTEGCDGFGECEKYDCDVILNELMIIALRAFDDICAYVGKNNDYRGLAEKISDAAKARFFDKESGLFCISDTAQHPSELANSLAVLSGLATGEEAEKICKRLADNALAPSTLSMKCFKYDALLKTDKEKYKAAVLDEIRKTYTYMLDAGADTAWEVIEGAKAFDNAGSLCHGWSAMPIYYYNLLL